MTSRNKLLTANGRQSKRRLKCPERQRMESAMKKRIGIIALLLAGVAPLPLFAEPMAGMGAQEEAEQASHQGVGKVGSVDRAKLRIKIGRASCRERG